MESGFRPCSFSASAPIAEYALKAYPVKAFQNFQVRWLGTGCAHNSSGEVFPGPGRSRRRSRLASPEPLTAYNNVGKSPDWPLGEINALLERQLNKQSK